PCALLLILSLRTFSPSTFHMTLVSPPTSIPPIADLLWPKAEAWPRLRPDPARYSNNGRMSGLEAKRPQFEAGSDACHCCAIFFACCTGCTVVSTFLVAAGSLRVRASSRPRYDLASTLAASGKSSSHKADALSKWARASLTLPDSNASSPRAV